MKWLVNGMVWESLGFGRRDGFAGIVLNISFFDATEEWGTFSFSRKIYKLALALVSGTWNKVFSLRNSLWGVSARASCKFVLPKEMSPFFLLAGENIIEKHISANPVCGTNIRAPELAVKGAPGRKCIQ